MSIDERDSASGATTAGRRQIRPLLVAAGLAVAVACLGVLAGTGHLGPSRSARVSTGPGSGPVPRTGAAMAWDVARHSVILFGARSPTRAPNHTSAWAGTS